MLYALTSLPPTHILPPLLILAHKSDLLNSSSPMPERTQLAVSRVRTILERELEKRRAAQAGGVGIEGLGSEGAAAGEGVEVGGGLECRAGGAFRFSEWEGGEVSFAGTWLTVGGAVKSEESEEEKREDGLDALRDWLDDISQ